MRGLTKRSCGFGILVHFVVTIYLTEIDLCENMCCAVGRGTYSLSQSRGNTSRHHKDHYLQEKKLVGKQRVWD